MRHIPPCRVSPGHPSVRHIAPITALLHHLALRNKGFRRNLPAESLFCCSTTTKPVQISYRPEGIALQCLVLASPSRTRWRTRRPPRRWLGSFPANDPLAVHGAILVELGALSDRKARRTPARLEAVFHLDVHTECTAQDADCAIPRTRQSFDPRRKPTLAGAVRPDAGLPALLPGVRARDQRADAEQQMAIAAARADRAADHSPGARRKDPPVSVRAVDSCALGRPAFAVPDGVLRANRATAGCRARRRSADDHRAGIPARAAAATDERRQPVAAPRRVGRRAAVRMVRAAAPEHRVVDGRPASTSTWARAPGSSAAVRSRSRVACCFWTRARCTPC